MKNVLDALKSKANKYQEIKKQRGVTLLEIIIVLGIIGVISAGVVVLAQRAFATQKITAVADSINTVHVSSVDAYGRDGHYPDAAVTGVLFASEQAMKDDDTGTMLSTLYKLGKISNSEARNGISGDYFQVQGLPAAAEDKKTPKGFVVVVNGLSIEECRSLLTQVANDWDYINIASVASGATWTAGTATLSDDAAAGNVTGGVIKSIAPLTSETQFTLTASDYASACAEGSANALILGSR